MVTHFFSGLMRHSLIFPNLIIFYFIPVCCFSQGKVEGEVLVKLANNAIVNDLLLAWPGGLEKSAAISAKQCLPPPLNVYRILFNPDGTKMEEVMDWLAQQSIVELYQPNYYLRQRETIPNDPSFGSQWNLFNTGQNGGSPGADINATRAWDITTGGTTFQGDTLVICVVDDGLDLTHEDFEGNKWVNRAEIASNGKDDDANGFIDDVRGWNVQEKNDQVGQDGTHGTPVSGLIGAKGNNGKGVSGVNWNVKIMTVKVPDNATQAQVLEGYFYPLTLRRTFNTSKGEKGALVVAVNSSFGLDEGRAEDAPIWCAFYDSLGAQGILSAIATKNEPVDIDVVSDIPSACPSDFIISVTSLDRRGRLAADAAFGDTTVDIGAFGEEVFSTQAGNGYGQSSGTSFAAPQVAGAIALLYSTPCAGLDVVAKSDPAEAAKRVKEYILQGAAKAAELTGKTVSGAYLDLYGSIQALLPHCASCQEPTRIGLDIVIDTKARIRWTINENIRSVDVRWRPVGDSEWKESSGAVDDLLLSGLTSCTQYEFQLRTHCQDSVLSYSRSYTFTTDGCCIPPDKINVLARNQVSAFISWNQVFAAQGYNLRYRPQGTETWLTRQLNNPSASALLGPLDTCTTYELQIETLCAGQSSGFGTPFLFTTLGCGSCLEANYCRPTNINAREEWIAGVKIGEFQNNTVGNGGFGNFTGLNSIVLERNSSYDLTLTPGFAGQAFQEYFQVWVDWDQNGIFSSNEIAFDPGSNSKSAVSGVLTVPADAKLGATRLRVVMHFNTADGPCSFVGQDAGEIEDYCVQVINKTTAINEPQENIDPVLKIWPNPAKTEVFIRPEQLEFSGNYELLMVDAAGRKLIQRQGYIRPFETLTLGVDALVEGAYLVIFSLENGLIWRQPLIIK